MLQMKFIELICWWPKMKLRLIKFDFSTGVIYYRATHRDAWIHVSTKLYECKMKVTSVSQFINDWLDWYYP